MNDESQERQEQMVPYYRKDEPGIISGNHLYVVDELSWSKDGHKYNNKLEALKLLGRELVKDGQEVIADIEWDDNKKEIIVTKKNCNPCPFKGSLTEVYVS